VILPGRGEQQPLGFQVVYDSDVVVPTAHTGFVDTD